VSANLSRKLAIVGIVACVVAAFLYWDLDRFLTLEYLKSSQQQFQALYAEHQLAVIAGYIAVYVMVAALSLPGAGVLTLAGGGFFGLLVGTLVVSVASTIGATLACLVARTLLRDWVQKKFGERLKTINEGVDREGGLYLFTVRLIPVFPFFVVNLVMGLTSMRLITFSWVSQLGMLPGTIVYVNAGKELAKIDSLSGILSPTLIASFVILGMFPITVKKIMQYVKPRFTPQVQDDDK
jgi:uncharacterized membrane protein YdjX (TVP38/TMEM64 family)